MGQTAAGTRVGLLGSVEVHVDGVRVPLRSHRQRVALTRLALSENRPVPVDTLVDDLWGDEQPADAPHALQAHISRLRKQLRVDVEFVAGGYRLDPSRLDLDTARFTALHEAGCAQLEAGEYSRALNTLTEALDVWRGPALGDLAEARGLRLSALHFEERRRIARHDRAEAALACGAGVSLVDELRAALASDPLRETTWHQLMRALRQAGREAEALGAYGQAREIFIDELGTEPGSLLADLHRALLADATDPPPEDQPESPTPATPLSPAHDETLVGRRDELAVIDRAWRESGDGFRVVTISGEPGIGKTRLAEAAIDRLSARGVTVLRARCELSTRSAFGAFAQLLQAHLATPLPARYEAELRRRAPNLAQVLPGWRGEVDDDLGDHRARRDDADHHRALDAIAAWLSATTRDEPGLFVIDDAQWADHESQLAIQHLLHSPRRVNALVIVCVRDRQIDSGDDSPLADLLRQSGRVSHLALRRFGLHESGQLIDDESERMSNDERLPEWGRDYILDASGGNPLFMLELTRQLLIERPSSAKLPPPPAGVSRVIESRIAALPDSARDLLRRAAVLGTTFAPLHLTDFFERASPAERDAALSAALHHRLIEHAEGEPLRYRFSHDIVRAVLYDSLPASERAELHAQIARALDRDDTGDVAVDHQLIAHHYRRSDVVDGIERAVRHLLAAGRQALFRGAPAAGEELLGDALRLADDATPATLRCDLLIELGRAQQRLAQPQYRDSLLEASRLARRANDPERLTTAVLANNRGWWSNTSAIDDERIEYIEVALAHSPDDDLSARAKLLSAWALENVRHSAVRDEVLSAAKRALDLAEESEDPHALALVFAHRYAVLHALFEDPAECALMNDRLMSLANRLGDRQMRLSAAVGTAQSRLGLGEFSIAERYINEAVRLAEVHADPARTWLLRTWQAMRQGARGDFDDAERLAAEALELGTQSEQADAYTWFAGQLFTFRMLQGRLPEIMDAVREQAVALTEALPAWNAALALALSRSGHQEDAMAVIDEFAATNFDRLPRDLLWLHALHYFTLACEELSLDQYAGALYDLLLPHDGMVATNGTIDAGPVSLHLGILARLQGRDALAEDHLAAAETLSRRMGSPVWSTEASRRRDHHTAPTR